MTDKLNEAGVVLERRGENLLVRRRGELKAVDVTTLPYSGFPTDVQAQMMSLLALAPGISIITERIFESRFMHVSELARLGADIEIEGPSAIVKGGRPLSGAPVMASDLRASAALVIAGLAAKGTTQVNRIYHLDRGYERHGCKTTKARRADSAHRGKIIGRDDLPVVRSRAAAQPYQFFIPHKIKGRDEQPLARALMKISPVPTTAHAPVPHF